MRTEERQCWHVQGLYSFVRSVLKENGCVLSYRKGLDEKVKTAFLGWLESFKLCKHT